MRQSHKSNVKLYLKTVHHQQVELREKINFTSKTRSDLVVFVFVCVFDEP